MIKQQNVKLGFALAMLTAVMWGLVPIAMKYALFALFATAVQYLSATTAQVVGQTGIVIFMISSAIIFKERLRPTQIIGITILLIGLGLFFNENLADLFANMSSYGIGVWLALLASISWVCYALAQKVLLKKLRAEQLLWLIYLICSIFLWPLASPTKIASADFSQLFAIIFCGLNTIIAYGALVMAMERWQAAQVSAITTLTPLFALIFSDLFALLWPEKFAMQYLNILGYIGAVSVVAGAMFATVGHYLWQPRKGWLINRKKEDK